MTDGDNQVASSRLTRSFWCHAEYGKEWLVLAGKSWLFVRGLSNKKLPRALFLNFDSYILTSCWREISSTCHYTGSLHKVPSRWSRGGFIESSTWNDSLNLVVDEICCVDGDPGSVQDVEYLCRMWYWQIRISGGKSPATRSSVELLCWFLFLGQCWQNFRFNKSQEHTLHTLHLT